MAASESDLGQAAARGGVWAVAGEVSSRVAQSVVFFVLAGILTPAQFGAAAVAFICVQVLNSLTYAGLGSAVQVLGPDRDRDRTAVGLALVVGGLGTGLLAVLAGPLCELLRAPEATNLVRLVGLALPLAQTSEVLSALLARDLRFRATGSCVVVASLLSAAVGLGLAAAGFGASALVAQGVVQPGIRLVGLVLVRPAAFQPRLHRTSLREIWAVGRDLLIGNTFDTAAGNVDNVAVSAIAGAAALGAYGFGYNLTAIPLFVLGVAASRVALPIYARLLREGHQLVTAFASAVEATAWLSALPLGFLALAGPRALEVVFGTTWAPVYDALRVLAVHGWLRTVETASTTALVALGHAATTRRVQQWQLLLAALLLPGLVAAQGVLGGAVAVLLAVAAGTAYSLRQSTRRTGTALSLVLRRMAESAVGGVASGMAGLAVLATRGDGLGLALALACAVAAWAVVLRLLRPTTVRTACGLLRPPPLPGDRV